MQVTIRNFAANAADIAGTINFEGAEIVGEPTFTASVIAATLNDGRAFVIGGNFQPLIDAAAGGGGDLEDLLTAVANIRVDTVSTTIGGVPWIDIAGIDLTGIEIFTFLDENDLSGSTDPSAVGDEDFDAGVAFLFAGDDTIVSDLGNDTLRGYDGNDIVLGMGGSDVVHGDAGNDEVNGNLNSDTVYGDAGTDFVRGGQADDVVYGGEGDDWHVNGNLGDDVVYGNLGNDSVFGGQGNDFLVGDNFTYGVGGNDYLIGNLGNDSLIGDPGNDTLQGGEGVDQFVFYTGDGNDVILDFDPANEVIAIEPNINGIGFTATSNFSVLQARITAEGADGSLIDFGAGHLLHVNGVQPHQLDADNFAFIF